MLASTAPDVEAALAKTGPAAVEWKLDGARIQVHRDGDDVAVFTRTLDDVTARLPEVVEAALALPGARGRARRRGDRAARRRPPASVPGHRQPVREPRPGAVPLTPMFFDVLHLDGEDLLDRPGAERAAALAALVPERVARAARRGEQMLEPTRSARGHEGVVVKSLDAPYEAGRRGAAWVKVKPVHTLDLVVLAVEWGHGRRRGTAQQPPPRRARGRGGFVMLGKTFKGLTDAMLAWQTEALLALEERRDGARRVTCGRSSSSRSRSTACRRARATPAASRCGSRASCATGRTSRRRRPTRSTPCWRCRSRSPSA